MPNHRGRRRTYNGASARHIGRAARLLSAIFIAGTAGCLGQPEGTIVGVAAPVTTLLAVTPMNEIEQIYYLGVFDPQEQVPSTIYRIRVHGQASAISNMRFGSGWVKAALIDSLNTSVSFDGSTTRPTILGGTGNDAPSADLKTGRRLVLFGPEGFREAPRDHRLVIVMGADPEAYFRALDTALGTVAKAQFDQLTGETQRQLFEQLAAVRSEENRLNDLSKDLAADAAQQTGESKQ